MWSKQTASCGELGQVFKTEHHHRAGYAVLTRPCSLCPPTSSTAKQRRPQRRRPRWGPLFVRNEPGAHDPDDDAKLAFPRPISLVKIAQSSKLIVAVDKGVLQGIAVHLDGFIRHRKPLRRKLSPFLFGGLIACELGLLLTPSRLQAIFYRQVKLGDAFKTGILLLPDKGGRVRAEDGRGDNSNYIH